MLRFYPQVSSLLTLNFLCDLIQDSELKLPLYTCNTHTNSPLKVQLLYMLRIMINIPKSINEVLIYSY